MSSRRVRQIGLAWLPGMLGSLLILSFIAALSGCRSHIDEMRMRINDAEEGSFSGAMSGDLTDNREEAGRVANEMNQIGEQLAKCNVTHLLYPRGTKLQLDFRSTFSDIDQLNSTLSCASWRAPQQPSAEFERHDGFLWDTFIVRFAIDQHTEACRADSDCPAPSFPHAILLTVPGKIHAINDHSDLVGINVGSRAVDDDTVRIDVTPQPSYREANLRYFTGRRDTRRQDALRFEIVSRKLNYNLNTIVSIIGVIFGSGFLIQLSRRFLFRKEDEPAPAKPRRSKPAPAGRSRTD